MEPLAKVFANVHGLRFKSTFAETLVHILHPISKVRSSFSLQLDGYPWQSISDCSSRNEQPSMGQGD